MMFGGETRLVMHVVDLDPMLMLFARDCITEGCWCIRVVSYTGLAHLGARAHKTTKERTVMWYAIVTSSNDPLAIPDNWSSVQNVDRTFVI